VPRVPDAPAFGGTLTARSGTTFVWNGVKRYLHLNLTVWTVVVGKRLIVGCLGFRWFGLVLIMQGGGFRRLTRVFRCVDSVVPMWRWTVGFFTSSYEQVPAAPYDVPAWDRQWRCRPDDKCGQERRKLRAAYRVLRDAQRIKQDIVVGRRRFGRRYALDYRLVVNDGRVAEGDGQPS